MYVIKESGIKEKLNFKKLKNTILNAGASERLANKAIREVKNKSYPGITTRGILRIVLGILKEEPGIAQRYNLKRAIMLLGPTGFPFEKFVARILKEYGYKTRIDVSIRGKCVRQEIDVIAKKDHKKYMIECKYHNTPGKKSDLKVVMYTHARYLDVKHKKFKQPWLVTNTNCTSEAIKYAKCVNLKIIGWKYPRKNCLEKMLVQKNLYPITTLTIPTLKVKQSLVNANMIVIRDLLKHSITYLKLKTRISKKILKKLREEVKEIINSKQK